MPEQPPGYWIDVHTHLNFLKTSSPAEAILAASAAGVRKMITIGTEPADHSVVLELACAHFPIVACTLGVHPHEGQIYSDAVDTYLTQNLPHKEVVAVGEIGLDYHYENSPREAQKQAFRRQLELAARLNLPVEIHTRDAEADTVEILTEYRGRVRGIIHCFTGTRWLAERALDLGFDISFSGVITFKNAQDLRDTLCFVPLDRMHVETDAPFLTPVPFRGQPNTPAFVAHTGRLAAELRGIEVTELQHALEGNARRMFPKMWL